MKLALIYLLIYYLLFILYLHIYARDNQVYSDNDNRLYLLNRQYSFRHFYMGWKDMDLSLK